MTKPNFQTTRHLCFIWFCCAISICLFPAKGYSQANFIKGYVLTNNNDTLKGFIDFRNNDKNSKICSFKNNPESQILTYHPGEIKGYRFNNGKYFVSKEVKVNDTMETFFLEYMVNGITDLYYYWNNGPHYLLEKNNGEIFELTDDEKSVVIDGKEYLHRTKFYKGLLRVIFQDCSKVYPIIEKTNLDNKSLINLTKKYHQLVCNDYQCIIYENKLPFFNVKFAPVVSLGYSLFSTDTNEKFPDSYKPSFSPGGGFLLNLSFPRWNDKFSVLLKNELVFNTFTKHDEPLIFNTPSIRDAEIKTSQLETSLIFKYVIPARKLNPTLQLGYCNELFLNRKAQSHATSTYNGQTWVYDYTEGSFVNNLKGIVGGVGCEFKVKGNKTAFVDLLFNYNSGRYASKAVNYYVYTNNNFIQGKISTGIFF